MLGELDGAAIERLLHEGGVGRIGCHHDGVTYVVPTTYVYDGVSIIGHTSDGMKLRMMRANPEVCFEIDRVVDMATWQSVIVQGRFEELHGADAQRALAKFVARFMPLVAAEHGGHHPSGRPAVMYRIDVRTKTGRFERP